MYDRDMPLMREHGFSSPAGLTNVVTFVLLTIQQRLEMIPRQFREVRSHGEYAKCLWGWKREGFAYVQAHKRVLYSALMTAYNTHDTAAAIDTIMLVPSLGLVKGAFVAQCLGFPDAACLDTINLRRLGLTPGDVRARKDVWSVMTRARKIEQYLALVACHGNARSFWNEWCEYKAVNDPWHTFLSADAVSAAHPAALGLRSRLRDQSSQERDTLIDAIFVPQS